MNDNKSVILVVDDTPANIQLLNGILRDEYRVKAATSGDRALQIASTPPHPDLILLDIMMPEMDGYEVCRQLKASELTAAIPVIFITARSEVENEQQGFALGAVDYIVKPFDPDRVKTRIRSQLERYFQQRSIHAENAALKKRISGSFRDFQSHELRQIIQTGENETIEFKSTLRWNLHTDKADRKIENACLKTAAAFMNTGGGLLLVGIDDAGHLLGLDSDRFASSDKMLLHWNSLLKAHLGVELMQRVRSQIVSLDNRQVLVIECLPATQPVFFRRDNDEIFFIRTGNGTQPLKPSEVLAYLDQKKSQA